MLEMLASAVFMLAYRICISCLVPPTFWAARVTVILLMDLELQVLHWLNAQACLARLDCELS